MELIICLALALPFVLVLLVGLVVLLWGWLEIKDNNPWFVETHMGDGIWQKTRMCTTKEEACEALETYRDILSHKEFRITHE